MIVIAVFFLPLCMHSGCLGIGSTSHGVNYPSWGSGYSCSFSDIHCIALSVR